MLCLDVHTTPQGNTWHSKSGDWGGSLTTDDSTDTAMDNDPTVHRPETSTPSQPSPAPGSAPVATKPEPLTCVVSDCGNTLTTNDGMMYSFRRKNKKFNTYACAYARQRGSPSTGCGRKVRLYPNGECSFAGDDEHISDNRYGMSKVKPPAHLNNAPKVISIVDEMMKLTDELTLDKGEFLSELSNICRSVTDMN